MLVSHHFQQVMTISNKAERGEEIGNNNNSGESLTSLENKFSGDLL